MANWNVNDGDSSSHIETMEEAIAKFNIQNAVQQQSKLASGIERNLIDPSLHSEDGIQAPYTLTDHPDGTNIAKPIISADGKKEITNKSPSVQQK